MFIDCLPRIRVSDLKELFRVSATTDEGVKVEGCFTIGGTHYSVTHSRSWNYLHFHFKNQQGDRGMLVKLHREQSNLGVGEILFFLCPYTGRKCRKLYLGGNVAARRYAFSHCYSYQNQSRQERSLKWIELVNEENIPYRKWGKPIYRGKPTRYFKKLLRYKMLAEAAEYNLLNWVSERSRGKGLGNQQEFSK